MDRLHSRGYCMENKTLRLCLASSLPQQDGCRNEWKLYDGIKDISSISIYIKATILYYLKPIPILGA